MKKCIVVCGPTASGKTALGIELARKHNTSIISADSRQCYRELNIGVAKPSAQQLNAVQHFFIDSHSIHDEVNVKDFEAYALEVAEDLFQKTDTVIMVGGTGLYIKAFAEGLDEIPDVQPELREIFEQQYRHNGMAWLQMEVQKLDPLFFKQGEIQNPRRLLRALEVKITTGNSITEYQRKKKAVRNFDIEYVFLNPPREQLHQHINLRTNKMMEEGLLEEAKGLFEFRNLKALQTVGYQEIFQHLEGEITLPEAVEEIKKNTRQYAKRQITWFKKYAK